VKKPSNASSELDQIEASIIRVDDPPERKAASRGILVHRSQNASAEMDSINARAAGAPTDQSLFVESFS
jgi:hypothetical protein